MIDRTRVRVTYEGTYHLGRSGQRYVDDLPIPSDATVEVLSPPDPPWWPAQAGDVALLDGTAWRRSNGNHYWYGDFGNYRSDDTMRGADLLARDGKRWDR